ncbi:PSME3-interacting protein-like isoform X1 [Penaeus japonicus]|uniref:PSME3-interacting protein-like isoform X1 n=1 Tax=Penaeus japonicus TaxID=27405 RepID=UPI001C71573D|nr:PSME3-interacting protein-like isoform X1 [Penaeus japonicus]XP_042882006.1 PSME3-interacting protein-like isoform X1 [Penaeus japonicus]
MSSGFISEKDAEEHRRIRQENWEQTRGEDDPLEPPEAPVDHRSLYDRLQEQRQKKQDEYDEAHKFKNMVRGLEDDEVDFLELVDRSKLQEEKRVRTEENSAMEEYRKKVSEMQKHAAEEEIRAEMKAAEGRKNAGGSNKKTSHLSLLAGAIKRKPSDDGKNTEEPSDSKKMKIAASPKDDAAPSETRAVKPPGIQCVAVLPGLGVYTDSSDSDNNIDSDSDEDEAASELPQQPRDITGRIVKPASQCNGQSSC